jgi:hypothetical protein
VLFPKCSGGGSAGPGTKSAGGLALRLEEQKFSSSDAARSQQEAVGQKSKDLTSFDSLIDGFDTPDVLGTLFVSEDPYRSLCYLPPAWYGHDVGKNSPVFARMSQRKLSPSRATKNRTWSRPLSQSPSIRDINITARCVKFSHVGYRAIANFGACEWTGFCSLFCLFCSLPRRIHRVSRRSAHQASCR